uniref:Uncharacterized protein n=1 Tax=Helianthus annuus TaxID=4232 RepID=A0A251SA38_HELAN
MDFLQGISWSVAVVLISIMYFFGRDVSGGSFVIAARVIFSVLGVSVYKLLRNNCHRHVIYALTFWVWIAYKESSWTGALFWIILLVCFRG